ncbi:MAG: endonuclease/exonuclease/phosphatase family protein [Myxococcales bacterium]|nr:endonuclease/exonuclease/phosphatase family protein [Myxococcales bacterium]
MPRTLGRLALGLVLASACTLAGCSSEVTIATFNIRLFPEPSTDPARVAERLAGLDASIVAVQEIRDAAALGSVLEAASRASGRDYHLIIGACGGEGESITTGVVYDAETWAVVEHRDYPDLRPDGTCDPKTQAGTLGVFADRAGRRLGVLSEHLRPFPDAFEQRREQWAQVLERMAEAERRHDVPVVALGDYNSTGWRGEPAHERAFIERAVGEAGYGLPTASLACTEYWRPRGDPGPYRPSVLDHAVTARGRWTTAQVRGMCERLACSPTEPEAMDPDFASVSDHCPVVLTGRL